MRFGVATLLAVACASIGACDPSPTTLTVHAILPPGPPLVAPFFDVTLTGIGQGVSRLIYQRPTADDGVRDQSFVVILSDPAVGRTLQVIVQAREARNFIDAGADPDAGDITGEPGDPTGRVVAAGAATVTIAGQRDNLVIVSLALQ